MPNNGQGIAAWVRTTVSHLLAAAFGGIASLLVVQYTTTTPELVYETFPPTDFASQTTQLSIYNARVENVGDKEAEDVQVRFELSRPTAIDEFQVEPSLKSISFDVSPAAQPNIREVKFARLNPGESSRFSILSNRRQDTPIGIEVRAKGIIGHAERGQTSRYWGLADPIVLAGLSFVSLMLLWSIFNEGAFRDLWRTATAQRRVIDQVARIVRTVDQPRQDELQKILINTPYRLFFDRAAPSESKIIRFGPNSQILEGRNNNETAWRIRQGLLELLDSEGSVHSRFYYSSDDKCFFDTNDPDTGSIRKHGIGNQYMIPEE